MNKIIILVLSLVLISCEKKDYVEEVQWRDYISKSEYKDGKSFDNNMIICAKD